MMNSTLLKARTFTTPQAANVLGWSRHKLYRLARKGAVPHHRVPGGNIYFSQKDLEIIEEMCTYEATTENAIDIEH